jgi:hypothetical protein
MDAAMVDMFRAQFGHERPTRTHTHTQTYPQSSCSLVLLSVICKKLHACFRRDQDDSHDLLIKGMPQLLTEVFPCSNVLL